MNNIIQNNNVLKERLSKKISINTNEKYKKLQI